MSNPFFSILLPTKNRSNIIADAIQSVLDQTFADFELVISDNDDSEVATAQVVSKFKDERIKYFRTNGKLPMYENWDNAFDQAQGQHVLVFEDKMRMVPNALEILHHHLTIHPDHPISYDIVFAVGESIPAPKLIPVARSFTSPEAMELFARFSQRFFDVSPKGHNSCAPRSLLQRIKKESPTGILFSHICPDYSFGFLLLSAVDSFLYLKEGLVYIPNNWMWQGKYSNGQSSYKKDSQFRRFMKDLPVQPEDIVSKVPIKSEFFWINLVLYDFYTKFRRPGYKPVISWEHYHAFCLVLILMGKKIGADMSQETTGLLASLKERGFLFSARVGMLFVSRAMGIIWQLIEKRLLRRAPK